MRRVCSYLFSTKKVLPFSSTSISFHDTAISRDAFSPNSYIPKLVMLSLCPCLYLPKTSLFLSFSRFAIVSNITSRIYCSLVTLPIETSEDRNVIARCDADKVYTVIMDNSINMEEALDRLSLGLSTDLVVEILHRLHLEEKMAFRFFIWASRQKNYSHEPCAYNEMIEILSSTKYKAKQFHIVCDMLDYMKRNDKNVVPIEVLLTILRNYTVKHLTHVQKFAKKKRIRVKTQPEINAFNLLLDAFCKCNLVEDAEAMFRRVKNWVKPDANTYNILFFGWCRVRNPTKGIKVLDEMIQLDHIPDNFTYNTAIDAYCKKGMVSEALELFEFMSTNGSTLSVPIAKTYAIMIVALVQNDKMDEYHKIVEQMLSSGCLPDVSTFKEIIEGMCLAMKIDEAYKLMQEMGNRGYPQDIVTYNCFLKVLCENKKRDEVLELYKTMLEVNCWPSVQTFNMLISMFFELDDPDGAFETWHEMYKRGCNKDIDTYSVMIEGLFGCDRNEDACSLIEEVVSVNMGKNCKRIAILLT